MSTSQKVVIVTGASQGIGAEIVKAFRNLDYRVVATSRTIKPSDDPNILAIAGDIGEPATAQHIVAETVAHFGRVDTLVNNAGIFIGKPFTENTLEDYNAVMHVNMAGFYHITQLALAEMVKQERGHVVTVTGSIDNGVSGSHTALAALTKGGLNAATRVPLRQGSSTRPCIPRNITKCWAPSIRCVALAKRVKSLAPSYSWKQRNSSREKSCTSTAARALAGKR
jgi:NAD(P)-dependent dehydrogenase (short-subunit alcohol dehydrogenase family)